MLRGLLATAEPGSPDRDSRRVATASRDNSLRVWDVETGHELLNFVGTPAWQFRTVFAPDGSWLAVTNSLGEVRVYRRP